MNETLKRYLWSSLQTFLAVFLTTLGALISTLDWANISWAAIFSIGAVALRTAIKAAIEYKTGRLQIK